MIKRFEFDVDELPPKKDGANSMWNKQSERERLIALRYAAAKAVGDNDPLQREISLALDIYCDQNTYATIGDLDNFITGVCDGLMKAHPNTTVKEWNDKDLTLIHPSKTIAIEDDCEIVEIRARKIRYTSKTPKYRVVLQGE